METEVLEESTNTPKENKSVLNTEPSNGNTSQLGMFPFSYFSSSPGGTKTIISELTEKD